MEFFTYDVQKILIAIVSAVLGFYFHREKKLIRIDLQYEIIMKKLEAIELNLDGFGDLLGTHTSEIRKAKAKGVDTTALENSAKE